MVTKSSMVKRFAEQFQVSRKAATEVVNFMSEMINQDITDHGIALIPGVGKLKVGNRSARQGRNPRTGEVIEIAARKNVRFRSSAKLRRDLA